MNPKTPLRCVFTEATILQTRELEARGISRQRLPALLRRKLLQKVGRGLYMAPSDHRISANHSLAEIAVRVPQGVICLLSALRFHGLTTQMPHETWIAIEQNARRPRIDFAPVRFAYFSGAAFAEGAEVHRIEGISVRIYCPEKTIADCFKFRNRIGLDIAIEALREARRKRICSIPKLERFAAVCRVANVMRPYMEAIL